MTRVAHEPLPIAILISGRGSNLLAIAAATRRGELPVRIAAVVSDQRDAPGLARARELGVRCEVLERRTGDDRAAYDLGLATLLRQVDAGLVVLAGFMRILGDAFVADFSGRLLNIHPSLLPKYRGLHTHARVLAASEREHGCSVHFVTRELDGGPVVLQARVPVLPGDTEETLSARVQAEEHRIYPKVIDWYASGRLAWKDERPWLDGRPLTAPIVLDRGGIDPK
ncbi:MAG TPA: phosphoribosylglycinamide formyltransferase [Steroidobacteraceae bacterium]|nr:phosphoribosylglycinamide formyltransferase [Steroidobacteraceae bacterium]